MRIPLREMVFSANSFVAAMLALFVSLTIGLDRPFWAMATVYIVSTPLSGTVRSKAVYRFLGTFIGGAVTVFMVPPLSNSPLMLSLAITAWISGCLFISLLDRTPRAYVFMLAGYTAALIGFPSVGHPEQVFDVAILRTQEIAIGVLCASLMHTVFWPRSVFGVLNAKLQTILTDAEELIAQALTGQAMPADGIRRNMAADITELHIMATHLPFDTERLRPTKASLATLQDRLMLLVPLVYAIEDRVGSLIRVDALPPRLLSLIDDLRQWVKTNGTTETFRAEIAAIGQETGTSDWNDLLVHNLLARLTELLDLLSVCRELTSHIGDPTQALTPETEVLVRVRVTRPLHVDYGLALLSATAAAVATLTCCAFWILTGWNEGSVAAMIAAVMCCFFSTMDDPTTAQRTFLTYTFVGVLLTGVYLFGILPAIDGFPMLALVLAPTFLILGAVMALPERYSQTMPVLMTFATGLALSSTFNPDFASFINVNFAQLVGTFIAILTTRALRVLGGETVAKRVVHSSWRELARLTETGTRTGASEWTSLMLDRIGLVVTRLRANAQDERLAAVDSLRDLRIGLNILQIRQAAPANAFESLLDSVGSHYSHLSRATALIPDAALLGRLDAALDQTRQAADSDTRLPALVALTGLRRNLFPDALPFSESPVQ